MNAPNHERVRDWLDEYALDILEPTHRAEVERHLPECAECAGELRLLELDIEGLARTVEPVNPSPDLKQRVLAGLAGIPQMESAAGARIRETSRGRPWMAGALAAAALLAVVLGGFLFASMQRERELAAELSQAHVRQREVQSRLESFAGQADRAVAILTAGDMQPIQLAAPADQSGAARAYWSLSQGLLLVADDLPQPPPGRVYQVWIIGGSGAAPVSAGLLGAEPSRRGMLIVPPPPTIGGASNVTIAITDEPPGGLSAPSGSIRVVGSV